MSPEFQLFFNAGLGVFMLLLGVVINGLREGQKSQADAYTSLVVRIQAIEVLVAGQYVRRDEFIATTDKMIHTLVERFDRVEQKLDAKADKNTCLAIHKGDHP